MAGLIGDPKRDWKARWLLVIFYLLLIGGGATMIYPFAVMLSGSISSELDFKDRSLVPAYLWDRDELFLKFLSRRYSFDERFLYQAYPLNNVLRPVDYRGRLKAPRDTPATAMLDDWNEFLKQANPAYLQLADPSAVFPRYQDFLERRFSSPAAGLKNPAASRDWDPVERMNRAYHQMEISFAFMQPPDWKFGQVIDTNSEPILADYLEFLRSVPPENLLPISGEYIWETWLRGISPRSDLRQSHEFPPKEPMDSEMRGLWQQFLKTEWPISLVRDGRVICLETDWRSFLKTKYETDAKLAAAWGDSSGKLATAPLLYQAQDAALFVGFEGQLRWRMVTESYRRVFQFLLHNSRALQNTVILVVLSILTALILNPLAAYGLSRYPGRHGKLALLMMVLTIAFPAEVAMIPSFLLLRDLNMLNTFAALVLPGAVSGFSVFLLKGFFDGLPEELFESARIDGASDLIVFWHVALPLSRPILAVTALGTFTAAYGGYMWALLVCQDSRMWTLMVWLFQFQMNYSSEPWLGMAAFVVASIPTLLVFIFCQRIILQGIIIPTEK